MSYRLYRPGSILSALLITWCLLLVLVCCGSDPTVEGTSHAKRPVLVAAASGLQFVLPELVDHFERQHTGIDVKVTYGSSGNFHAQLMQGAPFDLYLSADVDYPRKLIEAGVADAETFFEYAVGGIVLWVRNKSPVDFAAGPHRVLLHPSIRKIAIANPIHAPYGRAADAALRDLGVLDAVEDRLVLAENIAQAAQFVESGAADLGILSLSLALSKKLREAGRYHPIPLELHPPIVLGGVILKQSKYREEAILLRDFIVSERGQEVLQTFGYHSPDRH